STKRGNVHVEFTERDESAVAAQHLGDRDLGGLALLVGITQDELAGLDWRFSAGIRRPASFDMRVVQPILEAEWVASFRKLAELHAVDDRDLREVVMRLARELQSLLQALIVFGVERQSDVHVRRAERIFPVVGCIGTEVMQDRGARRHALPEFDRKTLE